MPLELIIREGDGPERRQVVPKQAAVMGRREDSDVVLPFSFVSARHGRVFVRGGLVHVEDMGSTNGTLVNGTPLEPMVPRLLGPDDLVEIDRLALRARWVDEAPASDAPLTYHEPVVPRALAPVPPAALAAPAGVWEIQAGAPPAAPPVVAVEAHSVGSTPAAPPGPFAASRTLARAPRLEGSGRLRLWALALQLVGILAVVGGLTLLLFVLLA
ncbi:MAG TPA: FHA domain-containing protein [Vicinamibacteria bacterium]|nr:FHA domain-containing protein [Vicinamibacteria bacterium]